MYTSERTYPYQYWTDEAKSIAHNVSLDKTVKIAFNIRTANKIKGYEFDKNLYVKLVMKSENDLIYKE